MNGKISRRLIFIPLLAPEKDGENEKKVEYKDYENMKDERSSELFRPINTFNCNNLKSVKASDNLLTKITRPNGSNVNTASLWRIDNLYYIFTCQNI